MASYQLFTDRDAIEVGKPMPFAVYSGEMKLLLAEGKTVETEHIKQLLLESGKYQTGGRSTDVVSSVATGQSDQPPVSEDPLEVYVREIHTSSGHARTPVRAARENTTDSYLCSIIGADEQYGLIITAPMNSDRSFVPVTENQTWIFRMMYLTAAVKFSATVRKVQFEPIPLITLSTPSHVEMRHIRSSPRVACCVRAKLETGSEIPALISDISVGGVRIAVDRKKFEPKSGLRVNLSYELPVLGTLYPIKIPGIIIGKVHELDKQYPHLWFAGIKIEIQPEPERVITQAYLYERMAVEFDPLWKSLKNPT
jgi:hypothetical protein